MSPLLANPYVILAAVVALGVSHGVVGWKAYHAGQNKVIAEQAQLDEAMRATREAAIAGAAEAISKLEVKHVTIRQKAETVTREVPVYRDCRHDPDGLQLVNEALRATPAEPADPGKLPGPSAADR